jgi:uncharacterized protein
MRPSEALSLHRTQIREIAMRHRVSAVRVFGSALRGDDVAGSDLDLLVEPTPQTTLMDIGAIRFELKQLLGLDVDVLTPDGLPPSFREQVLREAVALCAARTLCAWLRCPELRDHVAIFFIATHARSTRARGLFCP